MNIPTRLAVVVVPLAHDVDLDTMTAIVLMALAAGVGWFLWRRK